MLCVSVFFLTHIFLLGVKWQIFPSTYIGFLGGEVADFFVHLGSLGGEVPGLLHCSEWFVLRSFSLCLLGTRPSDAQPRPSDALQLSTHFFCCLFVLCSSLDSRSVTQNLSTCIHTYIHTYTYSVVSFRHGRTGIHRAPSPRFTGANERCCLLSERKQVHTYP